MKRHLRWIVRALLVALLWAAAGPATAEGVRAPIDWHDVITRASDDATIITVIEACPGCCSSHGGISSRCASNGNIQCNDGTTSPTCRCSTCGISQTPTCTGGRTWNGTACVCPGDQVFTNGTCTTQHTCTGGQTWNGTACACPGSQVLVNGVCTTPQTACTGGRIWNGSSCACPGSQVFVDGQCRAAAAFTIGPGISGNWYDPAQNGHGFQFEVLKSAPDVVTVFWFTFDAAGNQVWLSGAGRIEGNRLVVQTLRQTNGRFPPHFDSTTLTPLNWGTLTFTFADCTHARVDWTSVDPAFSASGTMQLEQLTQIAGTSCP